MWRRAAQIGSALIGAAALGAAAQAFVLEGEDAASPGEAVALAARWDANEASLRDYGERGLGGGLEYAIDDSVCALDVVDAPDCAAIAAHIAEAAARWEDGAALRFTDATGQITPERAPARAPWRGHGAEIDIFAVATAELARFHVGPVAADTRVYYAFAPSPRAPSGALWRRSAGRITAVDIRLNAAECYRLAPEPGTRACLHLGSVMMHEFAHALGLAHPDEHPERNLIRVESADAPASIDCRDPGRGLVFAAGAAAHAVANGRWTGSAYWTQGLSDDDRAGRDALYPTCS